MTGTAELSGYMPVRLEACGDALCGECTRTGQDALQSGNGSAKVGGATSKGALLPGWW